MNAYEPHRYSPEDEGIPSYADDTSTAEDTAVRTPLADSPPTLPTDGPDLELEYGRTAAQTLAGESLNRKLAREVPDRPSSATGDAGVGRLIAPDQGGGVDSEAMAIGYDSGERDGYTAEEAAMHLLPEGEESAPDET
jgi:hypothetical protein